jgi:hypothetical protein
MPEQMAGSAVQFIERKLQSRQRDKDTCHRRSTGGAKLRQNTYKGVAEFVCLVNAVTRNACFAPSGLAQGTHILVQFRRAMHQNRMVQCRA